MNGTAKKALWMKGIIVIALLILGVGISATQASAYTYTHAYTPWVCPAGKVCVSTTGNNFTMNTPLNGMVGGTNDIAFAWDGTMKTSVAVSGNVPNAKIHTDTKFYGATWDGHDVTIYAPGTYTIYPACPADSPGCGITSCNDNPNCSTEENARNQLMLPTTFTVGPDELGLVLLVDWNNNWNINCPTILKHKAVYGPSPMCTGTGNCGGSSCADPNDPKTCGTMGTNPADKVWDWMSKDWGACGNPYPDPGNPTTILCSGLQQTPDGINGAPMINGAFNEQNANWNVIGDPCSSDPTNTLGMCNDGNPCTDDRCDITNNTTGTCVHTFNTNPCDDGKGCTDNDVCSAGVCAGTQVICPDGGACNASTGYCKICQDKIDAGTCNDNNICTKDDCKNSTGACIHNPTNNELTCDDGNPCTLSDICTNGVCKGLAKDCNDSNVCTDDACNPTTGLCDHPNHIGDCGDQNPCNTCTAGVCTPLTTGSCVNRVDSTNNNFSMIDLAGGLVGGTNDVRFTWDRTLKTAVAVSGQKSNGTIGSTTAFFGHTWSAHDVAIYGPGTYTVYTDCDAGSPGCGVTTHYPPIIFTVGPDEIAGHMLFNWSGNNDIDVVDIWTAKKIGTNANGVPIYEGKAFAPSPMWTGAGGSNKASKLWDFMSKDWAPDGLTTDRINGYGMVDGPFKGFGANFNLNTTSYPPPSAPSLVSPIDGASGVNTTMDFIWTRSTSTAPDVQLSYTVVYCTDSALTSTITPTTCKQDKVTFASRNSKGMFYAGGAGLLMIGMTFFGGMSGRRRIVLLLTIAVLFAGGSLMSCKNTKTADGKKLPVGDLFWPATLDPATKYYWRVDVTDGSKSVPSTVRSFKTK